MTKPWITTFSRDERGAVAIWIAGGFSALLGLGAIAVDIGHLYLEEQRLQVTADTAVLAAAKALHAGEDAGAAAMDYVEKNAPSSIYGNVLSAPDVEEGEWHGATGTFTPGGASPNAVRVTLRRTQANGNPVNNFLAGLVGYAQMDIVVQATAAPPGIPGCILALDGSAKSDSLKFSSMGTADLKPCTPAANSTDSKAISISSLDTFRAGSLYAAGGISAPSWALDLDEPEQEYMAPVADPYASLPDPSWGPCDYTNHNASSTISPGVYCGGLSASGSSLTVEPGTYYIVDGNLDFSSINSVTCNCAAPGSGVTFVLTGSSPGTFEFSSISSLSLRAPSDASYDFPGMLIYVDRNASYATSKFSSIDSVTFNGGLYAPSQMLDFNSIDYTVQTDCMQLIGFHVNFSSIDGFGRTDNCPAYGTADMSIGGAAHTALVQ